MYVSHMYKPILPQNPHHIKAYPSPYELMTTDATDPELVVTYNVPLSFSVLPNAALVGLVIENAVLIVFPSGATFNTFPLPATYIDPSLSSS
jgi:hypothetical protein